MKLDSVELKHEGFLKFYELNYVSKSGEDKKYNVVSRHHIDINNFPSNRIDAVIIVPFVGYKILLSREFRLAVNEWVYNFPAGLVDEGETVEQAAIRELREETGLRVTKVLKILQPSYSSAGLTDERVSIVFVRAEGEITGSDKADEEIESRLYTKDELEKLIEETSQIDTKTQLILMMLTKM